MDNSLKKFSFLALCSIAIFGLILALVGYAYFYSTINTYRNILLILMLLIIILIAVSMLLAAIILHAYRRRHVNRWLSLPLRTGLRFLLPVITFLSGMFKNSRDTIRKLYVDINNILVESKGRKYKPDKVLLIVPHCLQSTKCSYKVCGNIENCRKCGACRIGDIYRLAEETGVKAVVATGGTYARSVIKEEKPQIVVSVACERDLVSGIMDVTRIPVLGIINIRPNGPCNNTTVDIDVLRKKLVEILLTEGLYGD